MSNKAQLRRQKMRAVWLATSGSTASRDTEYNDLGYNDYAWHINESKLSLEWIKARTDIIL